MGRPNAEGVDCPVCKARSGQQCIIFGTQRTSVISHPERRSAEEERKFREGEHRRVRVLDFPCPGCGAQPGRMCLSFHDDRTVVGAHKQRRRAIRQWKARTEPVSAVVGGGSGVVRPVWRGARREM